MDFAKISRTIIRFWRSYIETVIYLFTDCGDWHNGFAKGFNGFADESFGHGQHFTGKFAH
jgi:hypothetical protein